MTQDNFSNEHLIFLAEKIILALETKVLVETQLVQMRKELDSILRHFELNGRSIPEQLRIVVNELEELKNAKILGNKKFWEMKLLFVSFLPWVVGGLWALVSWLFGSEPKK
jgi:hypothetical protein